MIQFSIITVFPEFYKQFLKTSLVGRAIDAKLVSFDLVEFSDLCEPKERIDESVCGPGSGMIIKPKIIEKAIELREKKHGQGYKIFFSPQGIKLTQKVLQRLAVPLTPIRLRPKGATLTPSPRLWRTGRANGLEKILPPSFDSSNAKPPKETKHFILICPRYEGMDARVEKEYADALLSIGDYVLMGGDLPAQVFIESFLRLIPGVVGKQESVEKESFSERLLDYPQYGLPVEWKGYKVPEVVLSGNHQAIENWRHEQACQKTLLDRFDWLRKTGGGCQQQIPPHYVALMHTDVILKDGPEGQTRIGNTSITSLDLHDTARSCATYGVKNMFMVSPLTDQQSIMYDLLDFWQSDEGKKYNMSRFEAISRVQTTQSLTDTIASIEQQEGQKPLIIATSAKRHTHKHSIDYHAQGHVWRHNRPVLFLFGTGQGLSDDILTQSDFLLVPVEGMTKYTHLSVRSAVAVVLDRWLGLQPQLE